MKLSSVAVTFSLKAFCLISAMIVEAVCRRLSAILRHPSEAAFLRERPAQH